MRNEVTDTSDLELAEAYLQLYLCKPYTDTYLNKYLKLMDSLPKKEQAEILSNEKIKQLLKRVNSV